MRTLGRCDGSPGGCNDTDEICLDRVRDGDLHGFEPIYSRHHNHAESVARTLAGTCAVHELTSEAFARLLILLLNGRRPETAVRNFLTRSIRSTFHQRVTRAVQRARVEGKVSVFSGMLLEPRSIADPHASAFQCLPENWRLLLHDVAIDHLRRAFVQELEQRVAALLVSGRTLRLAESSTCGERSDDGVCRSTQIVLHLAEPPAYSAAEGADRTAGRGGFRTGPGDQGGDCLDPLGA